ncbi:hypothetical protein EVG20_g1598 [Dentipellis fragilis]|uniref:Uncharacterized protein n=1 Tax=Dentipellis fragilis TaxID=205917 RepID=A0A4Y9ZBM5_9AGAM|nr:hypothetical protein EVG20_g1598 [Dentipellis fragilis]
MPLRCAALRFLTHAAFMDTLLTALKHPPAGYKHYGSSGMFAVYLAYLIKYRIRSQETLLENGELKPEVEELLWSVKEENRPLLNDYVDGAPRASWPSATMKSKRRRSEPIHTSGQAGAFHDSRASHVGQGYAEFAGRVQYPAPQMATVAVLFASFQENDGSSSERVAKVATIMKWQLTRHVLNPVYSDGIDREVLDGLGLDGITALRVSTTSTVLLDGSHFDVDWRGLLGRFNAVEDLAASGAAATLLVSELYANPFKSYSSPGTAPVDPAEPEWLFPNLRRLKIGRTNFWSLLESSQDELCTVLGDMLRDARVCPVTDIQELLIEDCEVDGGTVEEFRRVVPKVSWDGHHASVPIMPDDDELEDEYAEPDDMYDIHVAEDWDDPEFFDDDPGMDYQDVFMSYGM